MSIIKIEEFSLTIFELWCYKAKNHFNDIEDEVGKKMIDDTLHIIEIFRQHHGELFFEEEKTN